MERRLALKNLLIIAGGTILLPSCLNQDKKVSIPLNHINVSAEHEALLAEMVETIIPKTDTPGARELGVHQFVLVMIDDCTKKEDQQRFIKELDGVHGLAKKQFNNSFIKSTQQQREELLMRMEKKEFGEKVTSFYEHLKRLTIQGYLKSQYVMTNLLKYELVPGRFHGSHPVTAKTVFVQNG
jgi:hypothetical protein